MTVCEVLVPILVSPFVMVVNVVRTCEVTLVGTRVVCGVDDADVNSEVSDVGSLSLEDVVEASVVEDVVSLVGC